MTAGTLEPDLTRRDTALALQIHPLGGSFVVASGVTGAVVLTNGFGRRIADAVRKGVSVPELAATLADHPDEIPDASAAIHQVLGEWEKAGLMARTALPFPDPVAYRPLGGPVFRYGGPQGTVAFRVPDAALAEQVQTVLRGMEPWADQPETLLEAVPDGDGFAIFRAGQAISGRVVLDAARFVLLREMAETACGADQVAAVFHAGAVARNGQALVICGESGQGKSTLTFGLVAAGCAYLGDDHIPLHRDGRSVLAFPTAAGVKAGSWDLPEIRALQDMYGMAPHSPRMGVRYLPLGQAQTPRIGTKLPVRALIFPEFRPGAAYEIARVEPEQALILALRAGSRPSGSHRGNIAPLADFLNHIPAYRLSYSSSEFSVPACLDLLNSPLP